MNRVRWFEARLSGGIGSFARKLQDLPLEIDSHMGFRIERLRRESVEATYFERFSWIDRTIDPFGRETSVERTDYKSLRFYIGKQFPELELTDPPRGLSSFFSRVAEITDFEAVIKPLSVNVIAWSEALRRDAGLQFKVLGISVSDLNVEDGITGRLSVISRSKDVQGALVRLLSRRTYSVQKIQLSLQDSSLVIAADGSVRSDQDIDLEILAALKETLSSSLQSK